MKTREELTDDEIRRVTTLVTSKYPDETQDGPERAEYFANLCHEIGFIKGVVDGTQEKSIYNFCGKHADWWPSTSQVKEMVVLLQKDWVGLTDDERMALFETAGGLNDYAKAIEAKLKEKNT